MNFNQHEISFGTAPDAADEWFDIMRDVHGLTCNFDARRSLGSNVKAWKLGHVGVTLANLSALALSPVGEERTSWQGDRVFVKLVTAGYVEVSRRGSAHRFGTGSLFVIDPAYPFVEAFSEGAKMIVLRVSKEDLRDRGVNYATDRLLIADPLSPDIRATSELIHCIAKQSTGPSPAVQILMGDQLLELVQFAMIDPALRVNRRSAEAVTHQARIYVESHLGDPELDIAAIAAAVHVSSQHLQRLFRSRGTSVMRYVWQARIERAARMLQANGAGTFPVQEIAWQCGFSTAAHFSRLFKQHYGESPSNFGHLQRCR